MIIFATDLGAIFEGVIYGGIGWVQTDAKLDSDKFDDSRRTKPAGLVESSQGVGAPLQTAEPLRGSGGRAPSYILAAKPPGVWDGAPTAVSPPAPSGYASGLPR